ncbi:hypothetical protein LPJ66_010461 [Kickxella alabastrina]|uniref:Uncharacterized protein n=1 Tax=Kickxella alabastrina TaxID=61397 RepID=A0ACC1I0X8_9FUNG|nr:hypothetical protein LPJ66_010461 [Kickxella alabastrina]
MPSKLEQFTSEVGFPIGCIGITQNNEVVLGGGGGAGRSGVKNKLAVYTIEKTGLKSVSELVLSSSEDAPTSLALHPKEKVLATSINASKAQIEKGENNNCRLFELKKKSIKAGKSTQSVCSTSDYDYQRCSAFDPSGKLLAGGSTNGTLSVIQYPQLVPAFPFIEASDEINDVDFNLSGKWLAVTTDKELKVISAKDGSVVQTIDNPHTAKGTSAVFRFAKFGRSKGSKEFTALQTRIELKDVLYTVLNTRSRKQAYIAMWDTNKWERLVTRPVCNSAITTFALSKSGRLLAFATASLQICICDAHTLRVLMRIHNAHGFAITVLAFDAEEKCLISGSADETCQVIVIPDKWPSATDAVVQFAVANLQAIIVVLVLMLGVLVSLALRN